MKLIVSLIFQWVAFIKQFLFFIDDTKGEYGLLLKDIKKGGEATAES